MKYYKGKYIRGEKQLKAQGTEYCYSVNTAPYYNTDTYNGTLKQCAKYCREMELRISDESESGCAIISLLETVDGEESYTEQVIASEEELQNELRAEGR